VLAGLFCFLGLIGWARFRKTDQRRYLILTCVAYFLALGAKENAAPFPAPATRTPPIFERGMCSPPMMR
ncbi:MAG: hypothetical protein ACE5HZ_05270, partial [Fidelibacterota bacterium]